MRKTIPAIDENPIRPKPLANKPPSTASPYQTRTLKTLETRPTPTPTKAKPPAFEGSNNRRKEQQKVEDTKRVAVLKSQKVSHVQTNSPLPARPWTRLETTEEKRRLKPPFTLNLPSQSRLSHKEAGGARITDANKKATNSIKKESLPLIKLSKRVPTNPDLKITLAKPKKQAAGPPVAGFQASKKGNDAAGNTKLSNITPATSRGFKSPSQSKLPPILKHSERQPLTTQARKSLKSQEKHPEKAPSSAGSFKFINSIPNETWSEDSSEKQSIPEARPTTPIHTLVSSEKADTANRPTRSRRKRVSKPASEASLNPEAPMTPAELWEKIERFSSWLAETLNLDNNGNPVSKKSRQENSSNSKESTSTESLPSQLSSSSLTNSLRQKPSTRRHPRVVSTPQPADFLSQQADIFYAVRKDVCKHFPGADINVSLEDLRRQSPSLANLPCFKDPMFFTSIKVPNNFHFANPTGVERLLNTASDLTTEKKPHESPLNNSRSVESLKTAFRTFQLPSWAKECFSGDDEGSETLKEFSDDYESSTISPALSVESLEASRAVQSEVVNKILSLYAKTKSPTVSPAVCETPSKTNIPEAVPDAEEVLLDESLTKEPDKPP